MRHPNLDTIHRGFDAFSREDTDTLLTQWTPDVVLHEPGNHALSGSYHGPEAILGFFGRIMEFTGGTHQVVLEHALADDHMGYALYTERGESAGRSYESKIVMVLRFQDGKIAEMWDHPRDLTLVNQVFSESVAPVAVRTT
jgi:uncharacterized protein